MMVREFNPGANVWGHFRDKVFLIQTETFNPEFEVGEIGLADSRLLFDADVVDQSNSVFEFTTDLMRREKGRPDILVAFFTSRRWRTNRPEGGGDIVWPDDGPLQFIGNPYFVGVTNGEIIVYREPSYLIKSGCAIQHECEATPHPKPLK